jgi:hypothetical protein
MFLKAVCFAEVRLPGQGLALLGLASAAIGKIDQRSAIAGKGDLARIIHKTPGEVPQLPMPDAQCREHPINTGELGVRIP